jgi:arylsulfatase A-like enzyme
VRTKSPAVHAGSAALFAFACAVFALLCASSASAAAQKSPPNILIILADDLGYGDIGCFGNKTIATPNIDALAKAGMRFTDFHSNGAVCSPTRAAFVTGRYQQRSGIEDVITAANDRDKGLPLNEVTFAEVLKSAGYETGLIGKWHLGYKVDFNPTHQGFDTFFGYLSGNVDYISHVDQAGFPDWWKGAALSAEEGYTTHLITQHSIDFLEAHKDKPFCLYVAEECVHYPYQAPGDKPMRSAGAKPPETVSHKDADTYRVMIEEMDKGIGQILATVDRLGLKDNTLVMFFSDNGPTGPGSAGPLRGHKSEVWEGGHRIPAIAVWPGKIVAGVETDQTAIGMDLMPTMLSIAGVAQPTEHKLDGIDLSPLLFDRKPLPPRALFWRTAKAKAMREGPWKLDVINRGKPVLFNLDKDLAEKQDLSAAEPDRLKQMLAKLADWEKDVGRH